MRDKTKDKFKGHERCGEDYSSPAPPIAIYYFILFLFLLRMVIIYTYIAYQPNCNFFKTF